MAEVKFEYRDNRLMIYISGEIDHHSAFKIKDSIDAQILKYSPSAAVMNFSGVSFMDSSGVAVVINAMRCMNKINGKLSVAGLTAQPMRVFRASGMDKLVEMKEVLI